jgi:hypothetical protein
MADFRLDPHHIEHIIKLNRSSVLRWLNRVITSKIFGKSTVNYYVNLAKEMKPETTIEVISGLDDICGDDNRSCPFIDYCGSGDRDGWIMEHKRRVPKRIKYLFKILNKSTNYDDITLNFSEADSTIKYASFIGKTFKFSELEKIMV